MKVAINKQIQSKLINKLYVKKSS